MARSEADITKAIMTWLKKQPFTFAWKIHGGPHQPAGLPDIICCHYGRFFGFEVKKPDKRNNLTERQQAALRKIKGAKGKAYVVTSTDEVKEILEQWAQRRSTSRRRAK